jgi:GH15 family glucan-1,4-alpha-glucosidase
MDNLNYGVIGNGRSAALVSEKGSIDWCCLPDFDSSSVFARILDEQQGGYFGIETDEVCEVSQKYLNRTNILCTQFRSPKGAFEVIDFMPCYRTGVEDYFTPSEIYRYIRPLSGKPMLRVRYYPALNYARDTVAHQVEEPYIRSYSELHPSDCIYLYSSFPLQDILDDTELAVDAQHFLVLSYTQKLVTIDLNRVYLEYQRTKVYWLNWTNRSRKFELYTEEILRSLLILKLMTYQPTGAILAALTTSIPETIGEVRNWDYRFCWLRDASMSMDTLLRMGHAHAAQRFLGYIKHILKSKQDRFQIMYGIRGERDLHESDLPHLSGYAGSKPVRIGNAAYHQRQHDVFGYLLDVISKYYKYFPGTLDDIEEMWEIVQNIAGTVSEAWRNPDRGIWEIRERDRHFVSSKVMSWVAMDRATKIALLLRKKQTAVRWRQVADEIHDEVMLHGWNESLHTFTQTYDNTHVDASLLLMAEYGFISYEDVRYRSSVRKIKEDLFHNGLMYRYVNEDDFGRPTSSFTICTFWLIQALFRIGCKEEAREIFDQLLACGNHLGLFSEDIDFSTKRLLGNFPQAYSHLALINTAILFSEEQYASRFIKP